MFFCSFLCLWQKKMEKFVLMPKKWFWTASSMRSTHMLVKIHNTCKSQSHITYNVLFSTKLAHVKVIIIIIFFNVINFWWSYITLLLCFYIWYNRLQSYIFSHHVNLLVLIGVHHLIVFETNRSLSRSRSWSECLRRRPRSSCFTRSWS